METTVEKRAEVTWIYVKGRLDTTTAPTLDEQLDGLINDGCRALVFELGELEYLSSAGLSCFFWAAKKIEPDGGSLVFVSPQEFVQRVFDVTGVAKLFRVCASADEV